jgi:hypothetical protein
VGTRTGYGSGILWTIWKNNGDSWSLYRQWFEAYPQSNGPDSGKGALTANRLNRYNSERDKTRNQLKTSKKCRDFLMAHGINPDAALDAVNQQRAYDGETSTISRLAAGLVGPDVDLTTKAGADYAKASVNIEFTNSRGAQIQAHTAFYVGGALKTTVTGRSDVYYRGSGLNASTILHEALHSLTGLSDPALGTKLGVTVTPDNTQPISQILHKNDCGG